MGQFDRCIKHFGRYWRLFWLAAWKLAAWLLMADRTQVCWLLVASCWLLSARRLKRRTGAEPTRPFGPRSGRALRALRLVGFTGSWSFSDAHRPKPSVLASSAQFFLRASRARRGL